MGVIWGQNRRDNPQETLAFLEGLLIECDAGEGDTVLVGGGPASGKTHLQHQLVLRAKELGILTLTAAGAADERDVNGGVIDQLLAGPLPPALTECLLVEDVDERIAALCSAVQRLARERAVLVAVDDLHHVDETSARLLLRLQRRTSSAALLLVLNHADGSYAGLPFTSQPHRHVELTPLSVQAIAELVPAEGAELPARIHELSAGNPLLVNALIDAHRGCADAGSAYSEAVQRLLNRYGSPLREVATAIAVLDSDVTTEAVAIVAGVDPLDAETSAGRLADTGLVAGIRFRPPAAAAVVDGLRGPEKVRLHARAAEVKHARGLTPAEVARHLVAAGEVEGDWGLPVLVAAAEQVMLGDDIDFATRCLNLAASVSTAQWEQQTISQLLAKITWRVNPAAAAPHLQSLREAGSLDQSDRIGLARQSLWFGDRDTFERAFAALEHDDEPLDPRTAAELTLAGYWHYGVSTATAETGDPWLQTANSLAEVWRTGGTETTSACAERILQNCRLSDTSLEALATAILALAHDDKADRAEGWCTSLSEEAEYRGAITWKAMLDAIGASLRLRRGDVVGAASLANRALGMLDAPNWGVAICYPLATLLSAHTAAGAFKEAAAVLRHPLPEAALTTLGGVRYLRARGHFHLATNRGLAAVSDLQQCRRILGEWDLDLPAIAPWQTDLAEANLGLGNVALAVDLAKQQLVCSDASSRGSALRVLALAGDAAARLGLLNRAAETFRAAGDRLELAKTMRWINQLSQRAERAAGLVKPVHVPRQGRQVSRPAGAPAAMARPVARPEPASASSTASPLSEAELRVAELAVDGRTNRQIAETLYITVSTVEQHLTRVYRKLGVAGRAALAGEFADAEGGQ
jgi:DNA-binding CsgD family transcriptional regulator